MAPRCTRLSLVEMPGTRAITVRTTIRKRRTLNRGIVAELRPSHRACADFSPAGLSPEGTPHLSPVRNRGPQGAPPGREAPRKKKGRALGWWKHWEGKFMWIRKPRQG